MNILILHNRNYFRSGPETYLYNLKEALKDYGHEVKVFSLAYKKNIPDPNQKFYPKPVGNNEHYSYSSQRLKIVEKISVARNLFSNPDVSHSLNNFLDRNEIDAAVILQFWGKLSPVIFKVLKERKIKSLLRISDFGLICGKNTFYRKNKICTECISSRFNALKYKCIDGSLSKTMLNSFAQYAFFREYKDNLKIAFPSSHTLEKFQEAGFRSNNLHFLPTFANQASPSLTKIKKNNFVYFGRVAEDKSLHNIIPIFPDESSFKFDIYGSGDEGYIKYLKSLLKNRKNSNITLHGFTDRSKINAVLADASFSIIPSEWFDNLPNSLIESLMNGVPVIARNHGCFSEFIANDKNGFLYDEYDGLKAIFAKVKRTNQAEYTELSKYTSTKANEVFSKKKHISKLIGLLK